MALLSGKQDCSKQEFLYFPKNSSDCSVENRCQSVRSKPHWNHGTLCFVREFSSTSYLLVSDKHLFQINSRIFISGGMS